MVALRLVGALGLVTCELMTMASPCLPRLWWTDRNNRRWCDRLLHNPGNADQYRQRRHRHGGPACGNALRWGVLATMAGEKSGTDLWRQKFASILEKTPAKLSRATLELHGRRSIQPFEIGRVKMPHLLVIPVPAATLLRSARLAQPFPCMGILRRSRQSWGFLGRSLESRVMYAQSRCNPGPHR